MPTSTRGKTDCHVSLRLPRNDVENFTLRRIDTERYPGGEKTISQPGTYCLSGHPDRKNDTGRRRAEKMIDALDANLLSAMADKKSPLPTEWG